MIAKNEFEGFEAAAEWSIPEAGAHTPEPVAKVVAPFEKVGGAKTVADDTQIFPSAYEYAPSKIHCRAMTNEDLTNGNLVPRIKLGIDKSL